MSIYFIIIIGIILFEYILSFIVRTLNIQALAPNLPQEFSDTFDKEKYAKSQDYTKTNSKFAYITSTFSLIVGLWFILSGFYKDTLGFVYLFDNELRISFILRDVEASK